MAQQDSQNHISVAVGGNFSCFAGSCRFDGFFPGIRGLYLEQSVPNTCELTFIAKEGEECRSQKHQFPEDELRSPPMIKHGYRCQRADKKETDLANTEQDMTQYNPMTEPDLRLKTASIPIGRLHYHKAKHRDGKVLGRTHHDRSLSQFLVIRKRVPEKQLRSRNLCDYRPAEQSFGWGAFHCCLFNN